MKEESIFDFGSYRAYITARVKSHGRRGLLATMATAARCRPSHISMVLSAKNELNQDQAFSIGVCLGLSSSELDYFLLLVQKERAAYPELRSYIEAKLEKIREKQFTVKAHVKNVPKPPSALARKYYTSWEFAAIHIALTIAELRTPQSISKRLMIPQGRVQEILAFLETSGLAEFRGGEFFPTQSQLHVPHDSPFFHLHHLNWRLRAIENVARGRPGATHYSSVVSLSKNDIQKLRSSILKFIQEAKERVKVSKEETLAVFSVDFFEL